MLKIDLEIQLEHVNYHVHDGRMINYRDFVQMDGDTPQQAAEIALKAAFAYYYAAAARISSDGP